MNVTVDPPLTVVIVDVRGNKTPPTAVDLFPKPPVAPALELITPPVALCPFPQPPALPEIVVTYVDPEMTVVNVDSQVPPAAVLEAPETDVAVAVTCVKVCAVDPDIPEPLPEPPVLAPPPPEPTP
jgi:hypothetical protein